MMAKLSFFVGGVIGSSGGGGGGGGGCLFLLSPGLPLPEIHRPLL